jgi:hypothetical protein
MPILDVYLPGEPVPNGFAADICLRVVADHGPDGPLRTIHVVDDGHRRRISLQDALERGLDLAYVRECLRAQAERRRAPDYVTWLRSHEPGQGSDGAAAS